MWEILQGNAVEQLRTLPDRSIQTCITSPPYWGLRDYGTAGQIGLEATPKEYAARLVELFDEVRRVLRDDGTLWLNLGDSYAGSNKGTGGHGQKSKKQTTNVGSYFETPLGGAYAGPKQATNKGSVGVPVQDWKLTGLKSKDLCGVPWTVALALRDAGWYLRNDIIWHKPNAFPYPALDRMVVDHEYLFLLSKTSDYHFDWQAIAVPTADPEENGNGLRRKRTVWSVKTKKYKAAHFATFPEELIEPCILAGAPKGSFVLDPFSGSGTTGAVAKRLGRYYVGIDLNAEYCAMAEKRIHAVTEAS